MRGRKAYTDVADRKKDMIALIQKISGRYTPYEVFSDFVRCCALATCNQCHVIQNKIWKMREQEYMDTIGKYEKAEQETFPELLACLVETLEDEPGDVLGDVFMQGGLASKSTGQFFTPYNVSVMTARLALADLLPDEDGIYHMHEPSCGSGGMVIAAAQELKSRGINYQRKMEVVAQDLDWRAVYMCYLQLSFLGIKAVVVQGDTLSEPYRAGYDRRRVLETPAKMGMLL